MKQMIIKGVAFLLILVGLNNLASFALIPIGGASEVMWNDYYEMEDLDTLYIGSSVCLRSFNPYILDKKLGTNSYNMGTPSQPIDLTYLALETALKQHDIERVYFGFGYFTLTMPNSQQSETAFLQARNQYVSLGERMKASAEYMFHRNNIGSSASVNFIFPWVYNHVQLQVGDIKANIVGKLTGRSASDEKMVNDEMRNYVGRGFGYYKGVLDYDTVGNLTSAAYYYGEFLTDTLNMLDKICELCEENGVDLIVVNTPRPAFDVLAYGEEYYTLYEQVKQFLNERGAKYYDFNFVKPEVFASRPEYYFNFEHLNEEGADAFSESFADFEMARQQGVDVEAYFYDWKEYMASIDYISSVYFEEEGTDIGKVFKGYAYAGTNVEVEYRFEVHNKDTGDIQVLKEYGMENECIWDCKEEGNFRVIMKVRQVGNKADYERYYAQDFVN